LSGVQLNSVKHRRRYTLTKSSDLHAEFKSDDR
jgi:hypothetical protein